ncbi:MAG TPA: VCBS repeat-containing protein [Chitinophagaceae bacterium]|nr:VCBS repeat-containing protein [Chitinophagaceae bacterium]
MKKISALLSLVIFFSCNQKKTPTLFELNKNSGIEFFNKVENSKDFNIFSYRNFYNGGGVAIGDINNDGLADVLLTSNTGSNKLFLNKGGFQFEDISAKAGIEETGKWNTGVVMADINSDGWLDIYICNAGINKWKNGEGNALFINNKNLTFTESAKAYGLDEKGYSTHAAFFDYDLDGDLDCYILNNSFIPVNTLNYSNKRELRAADWPVEDFVKGGGDKLLRNDNGKFIDVSKEANIFGSLIGFGLGVTVGDVNGDHYPDLYISNDFFERDYLYINQKNGTYKEDLENWIEHTSLASMGADLADINNDGYPDIFTTDMLPGDDYRLKTTSSYESYDIFQLKLKQGFYNQYQQNTLQVNNGNRKFKETAHFSGVAGTDWSWGALIFDADNDGLNDLYVCNGIYKDVIDQDFIDFFANNVIQNMVMTGEKEEVQRIIDSMPSVPVLNKAYRNNGNLRFSDAGLSWGFTHPSFSNGAAYGDLDNDGDLDMVINNVNMPSFVYENNSRQISSYNYISIQLKGRIPNSFAIGSVIKIFSGREIITREVIPSRGFQSSTDYKIIAGLGNKSADSVIIVWPDKKQTRIEKPEINKHHLIEQSGNESVIPENSLHVVSTVFEYKDNPFEKHAEDDFVDFYQERNIPVMLSREGPNAAVADVNKDGMNDIFIGGAKGQAGQLYLQTKNGFVKKPQWLFETDKEYEDVALLFFDCDNDGDQDLFIGAGGNNQPPRNRYIQHRLYKNNGKGDFEKDSLAFPVNFSNISVVVPMDYNGDGNMDLFVGGRSMSYSYGLTPRSYIYENNGNGKFTEVTEKLNPAISEIGMVTGAAWADLTGDKKNELIVAGEWMSPRIFSWRNGKMEELKTGLENMYGWWQSVSVADLDGDGDQDFVLGNFGENFYLRPDAGNPVKLWINDFDRNGIPDKIFSRTINGKDVPVFLKKEFTDALPPLKKENLKHHEFANKTIQRLFSPELIRTAAVSVFNYTKSCIVYNEGNGNFRVKELPMAAQLSSINAILCEDINHDGKTDLVLAGNTFNCLPQFGRLDANYGLVYLNKGDGVFDELPSSLSGITISGMVRDIKLIPGKNKRFVLFLRNNDFPIMYKLRE